MTSSQGDFTIDVIEGDMSSRALKKMKKLRAKIKPPMSAWSCYVSKVDVYFFLMMCDGYTYECSPFLLACALPSCSLLHRCHDRPCQNQRLWRFLLPTTAIPLPLVTLHTAKQIFVNRDSVHTLSKKHSFSSGPCGATRPKTPPDFFSV